MSEHFNHDVYVPIILAKRGERLALRDTPDHVKARMAPIFVIPEADLVPETQLPRRSARDQCVQVFRALGGDWGSRDAFVDLSQLSGRNGLDADDVSVVLAAARDAGLRVSPVVTAEQPGDLRDAIVAGATDIGSTVCLRLSPTVWANLGSPSGSAVLSEMLALTQRRAEELHLVLDIGAQIGSSLDIVLNAMRVTLSSLPLIHEWRSLTVTGTAMPATTADIGQDASMSVTRLEWSLWKALLADGGRVPSFGDYGVQHPDPLAGFDPRFMQSSAQLRYTVSNDWFIVRGRGTRSSGLDQIRRLASEVVSHPEFSGETFSAGDSWIANCARGEGSTGNQEVWRRATSNHHFAFVVSQLAIRLGS